MKTIRADEIKTEKDLVKLLREMKETDWPVITQFGTVGYSLPPVVDYDWGDNWNDGDLKMNLRDRFYLRGTSLLGLFNTITGALFNRVLVRHVDVDTGKTVRWSWQKGTDFLPRM